MRTTIKNEYKQTSYFRKSQKDVYIKKALNEILDEIANNPDKYTTHKYIWPNTRHIALKEITYILVTSLKEFLSYAYSTKEQITSVNEAKSDLIVIIKTNITNLLLDDNYQKDTCTILDDKLSIIYKVNEQVSDDPVIQFIYWAIKNIPRLCIDPKKDFVACSVTEILKDYFNNIFLAIDKYVERAKCMTSPQIRNFLSSEFIDLILLSNYYQKVFK